MNRYVLVYDDRSLMVEAIGVDKRKPYIWVGKKGGGYVATFSEKDLRRMLKALRPKPKRGRKRA